MHFFVFPPFFGFGFIFYFLPSIVALARSKRNTLPIFLLNLFLGWTLVGWVVALAGCGKTVERGLNEKSAVVPRLDMNEGQRS
jgi:Superinfection immunity protein